MAKITTHWQLPDIEIDTDTEHGEVEHIMLDGEDYADSSAEDFVLAAIGRRTFQDRVAEKAFEYEAGKAVRNDRDDRMDCDD